MGNIVTAEQGLLPLPTDGGAGIIPYPWWLNTALAIWALLALLCCWLLLLLYLLRYCCRRYRNRKYGAKRNSLREQFLSSSYAQDQKNIYVTNDQHFASAPLPPVPPYVMQGGNENRFRNIHERRIVEDEFYTDTTPYVTAGIVTVDNNEAFESDSEFISEEEIHSHDIDERSTDVRLLTASRRPPVTLISDLSSSGATESIEKNVQHNITKNYYINEEENYFIQKDPALIEKSIRLHDPEIQRVPGPSITTVNMAAERIAENPNWEDASVKENFNNHIPKKAKSEIVTNDPSLFQQDLKYEKQPNVYIHHLPIQKRKLGGKTSIPMDEGSTTSEMSGHDSESIYETIRVVTPRRQLLPTLEDEDEYKIAGVDEVEIEIKDLIHLEETSMNTYDDILSSSSALNNLTISTKAQQDPVHVATGKEEKEETTVTESIKTQQIQTTVSRSGQNLDESTFFMPLATSSAYQGEQRSQQQNNDGKIIIPVSTEAIISHKEHRAFEHF